MNEFGYGGMVIEDEMLVNLLKMFLPNYYHNNGGDMKSDGMMMN